MAHSNRDLKQRVFTCLNKLSDRDTHSIAAGELESIARTLSHDSFSMFLSCIHSTDVWDKSPVRKQCVRLLGYMSEAHKDALSPHVSKMLSNIVRRLRDPDNAVRMTCIEAVTTMSAQITKAPFGVFMKPLTEALSTEQEQNSQIGAAMCLAAAIDASPDPELVQLRKLLPKLEKLLKCQSFKAKAAVLALIGSVVEAGGASSHGVLRNLMPCLIGFLSSEDWAARKSAAEALGKLAITEKEMCSEFKASSLKVMENRRFDKIKLARETMNLMLEVWKEVPDLSADVSPPLQSQPSSKENAGNGCFPSGSNSRAVGSEPLLRKKNIRNSRSPPMAGSLTTVRKRTPLKNSDRNISPTMSGISDRKKPSNWNVEVAIPKTPISIAVFRDDTMQRDKNVDEIREDEMTVSTKAETRRVLFTKRNPSRVVPCHQENFDSTTVDCHSAEDSSRNYKEYEDLALIRKQLLQIENQQSNLLDLLQNFIGTSQTGMRSLETRVHGLEVALDEISYDLAVSNGRMANTGIGGTTCCMLPSADFLSSKFWRKSEGRYLTSMFSPTRDAPSISGRHYLQNTTGIVEPRTLENRRLRLNHGIGFVKNPLAEIHSDSREISQTSSSIFTKNCHIAASPVTGTSLANVMSRSSA